MFILCDAIVTTDVRFQSRGMGRTDGAGVPSIPRCRGIVGWLNPPYSGTTN